MPNNPSCFPQMLQIKQQQQQKTLDSLFIQVITVKPWLSMVSDMPPSGCAGSSKEAGQMQRCGGEVLK